MTSFSPFPSSEVIAQFKNPFKKLLMISTPQSLQVACFSRSQAGESLIHNIHPQCRHMLQFKYTTLSLSIMSTGKSFLPFCTCLLQNFKSIFTSVGNKKRKPCQNTQESFIFMHRIGTRLMKDIVFLIAIVLLGK